MEELRQAQLVVEGRLTTDAADSEICDRENFETLLRLSRASRAPEFQTVDIHQLPLFLAHHQGVTQAGKGNRSLMDALLPLLGWSAPAGLWESDLLPVRLTDYQEDWLDQAIKSGELCWLGKEGGKVLFSLEHELDLIQPDAGVRRPDGELQSDESVFLDLDRLFTDPHGRYPFQVLLRNSHMNAAELTRGLWQAVWRGEVTNDSFTALRHGIAHRFDMPEVASMSSLRSRRRRGRIPGRQANRQWQASLPQGNWYRIEASHAPSNELEREERNKERARLLLDRYGVVFRELLARELPHLQWGSMFRSLRLMELAGEVIGGHFFSHVPGLQFISPQALEQLQLGFPSDCIFWINATDPSSVCSLGLPGLKKQLPKRLPGNHLVYHGSELVVISRNHGNSLHIDVPADHPKITSYFKFLDHLLYRKAEPLKHILIERINDLPAGMQSAYIDHLTDAFEVVADPKGVVLYKRHE
jgi:ATP-dependent Lhr-like helicase